MLLQKKTIEVESEVWIDDDNEYFGIQPIFVTSQIDEEDQILNLMNNNDSSSYFEQEKKFQEQCNVEYLSSHQMDLHSMENFGNSLIEIFPGKTLNINDNLEESQNQQLIKMLQEHSSTYAWEYTNMKGIYPNTCMHRTY